LPHSLPIQEHLLVGSLTNQPGGRNRLVPSRRTFASVEARGCCEEAWQRLLSFDRSWGCSSIVLLLPVGKRRIVGISFEAIMLCAFSWKSSDVCLFESETILFHRNQSVGVPIKFEISTLLCSLVLKFQSIVRSEFRTQAFGCMDFELCTRIQCTIFQ
jgi:hypothetical protein